MKRYIVFLILLITAFTHAAQPPIKHASNSIGSRPLIIIWDPHNFEQNKEDTFNTLMKNTLPHKTAPILISASIWSFLLENKEELRKTFNPAEWRVYGIRQNEVLLFIPKIDPYESYLSQRSSFTIDKHHKISDGELWLGIKFHHLREIDPLRIPKQLRSTNLKTYLNEILVTHTDIKHIKDVTLNQWDIFLIGHGISNPSFIGGMSHAAFTSYLTFLNDSISTRTLFYISCFSGGKHLKTPYEFLQKGEKREKDFNFTIIAGTIFDLIINIALSVEDTDFTNYFKQLNEYFAGKKDLSLSSIVTNFDLYVFQLTFTKDNVAQIPTIRFPHTGWFKITDVDKKVYLIDNNHIIRAVNAQKNVLTVPKHTNIILANTYYIPIPVVIEGNQMPVIIPHDIKNVPYFFKEIKAPGINLAGGKFDFKGTMAFVKNKFPDTGLLFIESLTMKVAHQNMKRGTLGWGNKPLTFKNVVIDMSNQTVLLMYDGQRYLYAGDIWKQSAPGDHIADFMRTKNKILGLSNLPDAMKSDKPTPLLSLPALHKYMMLKQKPPSTPEEQSKYERLLKYLGYKETPTEIPAS